MVPPLRGPKRDCQFSFKFAPKNYKKNKQHQALFHHQIPHYSHKNYFSYWFTPFCFYHNRSWLVGQVEGRVRQTHLLIPLVACSICLGMRRKGKYTILFLENRFI